jgi:hypothetical protein
MKSTVRAPHFAGTSADQLPNRVIPYLQPIESVQFTSGQQRSTKSKRNELLSRRKIKRLEPILRVFCKRLAIRCVFPSPANLHAKARSPAVDSTSTYPNQRSPTVSAFCARRALLVRVPRERRSGIFSGSTEWSAASPVSCPAFYAIFKIYCPKTARSGTWNSFAISIKRFECYAKWLFVSGLEGPPKGVFPCTVEFDS